MHVTIDVFLKVTDLNNEMLSLEFYAGMKRSLKKKYMVYELKLMHTLLLLQLKI